MPRRPCEIISWGCRLGRAECRGTTDGIDGSEDNAGAVFAPDSLKRAEKKKLDAAKLLSDNDAYGFFSALGDLVVTGPMRTNVNDYRVILVAGQ